MSLDDRVRLSREDVDRIEAAALNAEHHHGNLELGAAGWRIAARARRGTATRGEIAAFEATVRAAEHLQRRRSRATGDARPGALEAPQPERPKKEPKKEANVKSSWIKESREVSPEVEERRHEKAQERADAETEQRHAEQREELLARYRAGESTPRMEAAVRLVQHIRALAHGRWVPSNGSVAADAWERDQARSLRTAERAAEEGVRAALEPLIEAAEAEFKAALLERDRLVGRRR